jgi:hypothetical protein
MSNKYRDARKQIQEFRVNGRSLDELQLKYPEVPKSTMYYWIKDIPLKNKLTRSYKNLVKGRKVYKKMLNAKYHKIYTNTIATAAILLEDPVIRDFVLLYMCEGDKKDPNVVSICNSDERIIRFSNIALIRLSGVQPKYKVQAYEDLKPSYVIKFWQNVLGVTTPISVFVKKLKPATSRKTTLTNGVCYITVYNTDLKTKLTALMHCVKHKWENYSITSPLCS